MKRILLFILIFLLFCITGCQPPGKQKMLEVYSNNENYITLQGEIIEINNKNNNTLVTIKCEEFKKYIPNEKDVTEYLIFSNYDIDIQVGDNVMFITSNIRFEYIEWLPIVSITRDNITLLEYNEGKKNLINWVNQLQMK